MNRRLYFKPSNLLSLALLFAFAVALHGQAGFKEEEFFEKEKPVVSYYEDLDDKTFYHQRRIHGMKGELNSYSKKLHNLQDRFDQIFYGLSGGKSFKTPFDVTNQPSRPKRTGWYEANATIVDPASRIGGIAELPAVTSVPSADQLAFKVNAQGEGNPDEEVASPFSPTSRYTGSIGKYLIITPGLALPFKTHSDGATYRKYDPGLSLSLAGGLKRGGLRFGLGVTYKKNSFHNSAKEVASGMRLGDGSKTYAFYLDLAYEALIAGDLGAYAGLGLGYYHSRIQDLAKRTQNGFFGTGALGLTYNFSDLLALRLGYRYFHEDEVPAHMAELGLDFEF